MVSQKIAWMLLSCLLCSCTIHQLHEIDNSSTSLPQPAPAQSATGITDHLFLKAAGFDPHVQQLVRAITESGNAQLIAGNHAKMLIDGPETFEAMIEAINSAKHHVHLETYRFSDDKLGRLVKRSLIAKAREGISVRVIYDGFGSFDTSSNFFSEMSEAGVEVLPYKPINVVHILPWQINNRDHRKLLIVDGALAFTGGINITDAYTSSSSTNPGKENGLEEGWRDTNVMIRGPATNRFQQLFLESWLRLGGEPPTQEEALFPENGWAGHHLVAVVASRGDEREANVYATYLSAIKNARQNIFLMNAYFVPNETLVLALQQAAQRGVDVALMVPGFTDSTLSLAASRARYEGLLESGVRIYQHQGALLHAKTGTIDGVISIVGSANLDIRSFLHNNEINAVIVSSSFARQSEIAFELDLKQCTEITLKEWRQRPLVDKFKEALANLFSYWL